VQDRDDKWSRQLADHQQQDTDERDPEKREQQLTISANVDPRFAHVVSYGLPHLLPKRSEQLRLRALSLLQSAFGNRQDQQGTDDIDNGDKHEEHIKGEDLYVNKAERETKGREERRDESTKQQETEGLRNGEGDIEQRERRRQVVLAHEQGDGRCLGRRKEQGNQ